MNRRLSQLGLCLLFVCTFVFLVPTDAAAQCNAAWVTNTFYGVGAKVSYNARNYTCQQAHTSQAGWEPPNVAALWVDNGACGGTSTPTNPPATATATNTATATPTGATTTPTNPPSATATSTATSATATPTNPPATATATNPTA